MKTLILLLIAFHPIVKQNKADSVYLCMGRYSYAYHASLYCKGLRYCRGKEIKVSLKDAINKYHRKPCGYCER